MLQNLLMFFTVLTEWKKQYDQANRWIIIVTGKHSALLSIRYV